jgi:3-methyladenine DNA glycosylase AlkD
MTAAEVLNELESLGTEQNRKVYRRHGVGEKMYGVSYANLGTLAKKIRRDHDLAVALWQSGNHDARVLATMIADPDQATAKLLQAWAKDLDSYVLTDAFSGYAAATPLARQVMEKWVKSGEEWIGTAGWNVLCRLALSDRDLPDEYFEPYLATIAQKIHQGKNRVRYAMNGAVISIGLRNGRLQAKALAAAETIGKVEVDHGETNCQTPDAAAYIRKAAARTKAR